MQKDIGRPAAAPSAAKRRADEGPARVQASKTRPCGGEPDRTEVEATESPDAGGVLGELLCLEADAALHAAALVPAEPYPDPPRPPPDEGEDDVFGFGLEPV